jgi:hypothetical protein
VQRPVNSTSAILWPIDLSNESSQCQCEHAERLANLAIEQTHATGMESARVVETGLKIIEKA